MTSLGLTFHNLKIKWEFLRPFSVFRVIFLQVVMEKSAEGGLKSMENTNDGAKVSSGK